MKLKYITLLLILLVIALITLLILSFNPNIKTEGAKQVINEKKYTIEEITEQEEIVPEETTETPIIEESKKEIEVLNEITIVINDLKFYPKEITIPLGTIVTWFNNDTLPHKVVAYDRLFYCPRLEPGDKYNFTFTKEGTHSYFDAAFPKIGRGKIIVKEEPLPITGSVIGANLSKEENNAKFALLLVLFIVMVFGLSHGIYKHHRI